MNNQQEIKPYKIFVYATVKGLEILYYHSYFQGTSAGEIVTKCLSEMKGYGRKEHDKMRFDVILGY